MSSSIIVLHVSKPPRGEATDLSTIVPAAPPVYDVGSPMDRFGNAAPPVMILLTLAANSNYAMPNGGSLPLPLGHTKTGMLEAIAQDL